MPKKIAVPLSGPAPAERNTCKGTYADDPSGSDHTMKTIETRFLLSGLLALAAVLVAGQALAGIVVPESSAASNGGCDPLGHSRFDGLLDSFDRAAPLCSTSPTQGEEPAPFLSPYRFFSDSGWGGDAAPTLSTSSASNGALAPHRSVYLPDPSLATSLAGEGAIIFSTGPPFELLRPA